MVTHFKALKPTIEVGNIGAFYELTTTANHAND